jgi:GTP cyclohydrolase II
MNADGTMARLPQLQRFARRHNLKIISVNQLIKYRLRNEKLVQRVAETVMPTEFGEWKIIAYRSVIDPDEHVALVLGDVAAGGPVLGVLVPPTPGGVYHTPGGTLIRVAHQAVESLTLDREVLHLRDALIPRYAEMIYYGYWFSPERRLLQALMDEAQAGVWGTARLKLYKGQAVVVGRRSDKSLYRPEFATFEEDEVYRQKDAEGFIRLNGLRLKIRRLIEKS